MKVNYYMVKGRPDTFGKEMIYFSMYVKGERLRIFTGLRVDSGNWNNKTNTVSKDEPGYEYINDLLRSMENEARDIWMQYRLSFKKYPSFQYMKDNLSFVKKSGNGFFEKWDEFVTTGQKLKGWTIGTVKRFNTVRSQLVKLSEKYKLSFDSINDEFLLKFLDHHFEQGFFNTYVYKNYKLLKWFLTWSTQKGYNRNLDYQGFEVSLPMPSVDDNIYYLTLDELNEVLKVKITNEGMAMARDVFMFACFTGLRYSDLERLKKTDINDEITVTTLKTRKKIRIPLNDVSRAILNKYQDMPTDKALPVISNQQYNQHLKDIGKAAKLTRTVTWINYRGSERVEMVHPLWTKLTTHTARKTFITLGVFLNIKIETMVEYTGQTLDIVRRYYDIMPEEKTREMKKLDGLLKVV